MNQNNIGLREFAKQIGMSHSTLSRIINNSTKQKLQPLTKRKISNFIGIEFEKLCSEDINSLLNKQENYKISFINLLNGKSTNETILSEINYTFALNIQNDDYHPLFPKGSILFFLKTSAYQKDICIVQYKNKLLLCLVNSSYRFELELIDLKTKESITTLRSNIKAVLMKSLNPKS
jgi:transcriptional regulator with XRE-family HTH domain